jgi:sugar phosphate isomerase/epimerase
VKTELKRRDLLGAGAAVVASGLLASPRSSASTAIAPRQEQFRFGLNTSTIRGQKLSIVEEVDIAAKAGYQALEPWIDELERYAQSGGSLEDLGKRLKDAGITVESAIGFCEWIVDDAERRKKGLESVRRAMELVQKIGGKRLGDAQPAPGRRTLSRGTGAGRPDRRGS